MKLGLIVVLAAWLMLPSRLCQANPVPDRVAQDFRALVLQTAATGTCPDTSRLIQYFGNYGINLLSDSDLDEIDRAFAVFAPLLVEAQRPCEELDFKLQEFYRERATAEQRAAMTKALREWLSARLDSAPWSGVISPGSYVRTAVQQSRCVAAEMLVALADVDAAPLINRVAAPDTMAAEFQWFLKRSVECLTNPTARSFLHVDGDGSVGLSKGADSLEGAYMERWNHRAGDVEYTLTPQEIAVLFSELGTSRFRSSHARSSGASWIRLEFDDGVVANVNTSDPDCIVYTDNTSLDRERMLLLENPKLRSWIQETYDRRIGDR